MRLLFVASDPMEFTGILAHVGRTGAPSGPSAHPLRTLLAGVDWARSATLGGHDVLLAANGVGWNRAGVAVDRAAGFRPDAVISTGFCGALDADLGIGDIVVGTCVEKQEGHTGEHAHIKHKKTFAGESTCATVVGNTGEKDWARSGIVCSIDHVVQKAEEKARLRASGASVVEMEAAGVAERATALGLRFHCVKAVTDLAGETMANDFNSALRSDGHFDTMLILRNSLRHPFVRLPELLRLRNRCLRAARRLGEFFADCRF